LCRPSFATILLLIGVYLGVFEAWFGAAMFLCLVAYIFYQYKQSERSDDEEDEDHQIENNNEAAYKLILGFASLILGAEVLVQGAIAGGQAIGVSEAVIGLTVIALGTSLPELGACVAAARKKHTDIIVGGIVGSNIFNILSIVGVTSIIKPLIVVDAFTLFDMAVLVGATVVASFILLTQEKFGKYIGVIFISGYFVFNLKQFL
jgi:cation:H+ antiporter